MFYDELKYTFVYLGDARSIVMTSFFSHKTISYLDLQISQGFLYNRRGDRRLQWRFRSVFSLSKKSFFCTEESFRNNLVPKRRLLYTLNLDFPEGREFSNLRSGCAPVELPFSPESLFIAVGGSDGFFKRELVDLIKSACEQTGCKFKILTWMAVFRPLEPTYLLPQVQYSCAMILYHECVDSEFAMKFFVKFIRLYAFYTGELKVLEYLLYHARLCDFDVRSLTYCRLSCLTDFCIQTQSFRLVHSFLKYEDTVYYTEEAYEGYKKIIFRNTSHFQESSRLENQMSKLRLYRMLQILYIFHSHEGNRIYGDLFDQPDASEALRLVWRSIPDCLVSLQEMNDAYEDMLTPDVLSRAHSFYEEAIRQTVSCREPRTLSQYCSSVVRKSLHDSKQWLPDGIKQLKLPPRLESFLNLE